MGQTMTRAKKARRDYRDENGNKIPGVTSVIGPTLGWKCDPLMWWAARLAAEEAAAHAVALCFEHEPQTLAEAAPHIEAAAIKGKSAHVAKREKAADLGKIAHAIAESLLTGELFENEEEWADGLIEKARPNGERIVRSIEEAKLKPKIIERAFIGPGFGGTVDLVCEDEKDELVLIDYKSGKHVADEVCIQQGAYAGLMALHGINVSRAMILHCPIGEPIRWIPITKEQLTTGMACFAALFMIYNARKSLKVD